MEPTGQSEPPDTGLPGNLRRMAAALLSAVQNRVELFALELREEKLWLLQTLLWAGATVFFAAFALVLVTGTIVYLVPAGARPWVLLALCVLYVALALGAFLRLRKQMTEKPAPFDDTVGELKKDIAWLRPPR